MDFAWPIGEIWSGYKPPYARPCPMDCEGGWSKCYLELRELLHEVRYKRKSNMYIDAVLTFLNGGDRMFINDYTVITKLGELAGLPEKWCECAVCHGNGYHPDDQAEQDAWTRTEPPAGDGYQMWETTSEGSPQSPVFASLDELCAWLEKSGASWFGKETATADEWTYSLSQGTAGMLMFVVKDPPDEQ